MHPLLGVGHSSVPPPTAPTGGAPSGDGGAYRFAAPPPARMHSLSMSQSPGSSDAGEQHGAFRHFPPAGPPSINGAANTAKKVRRSSQLADGGDDESYLDEDGQQRKRTKQSLSCGECKRRKIKCDRKVPCSSCIKRGQPEACSWEDAKIEPEKQPFALSQDLDDVRERLKLVERFINSLPPGLKGCFAELGITSMGERPKGDLKQADHDFEPVVLENVNEGWPKPGCVKDEKPTDSLSVFDNMMFDHQAKYVTSTSAFDGSKKFDPDYTAWRTSIVAQPVTFASPATAANHGLELCFNQDDFDRQYRQVYDRAYSILPDKEAIVKAASTFFHRYEWFFAVLHKQTFLCEVDRFLQMYETGRRYDVDPAWLSLLFSVIALGGEESAGGLDPGSPDADQELAEYGLPLHAAAIRFHVLSDPGGKAQIRTLQAVTLFACWTIMSAAGGLDFGRFASWLAQGIRTGHKLGLHLLSTDPEHMPPDDVALPPGKNSLKRETVLKLWGFMTFFDHLGGSGRYRSYLIHPSQNSTPPLSNVNWSDLSVDTWQLTPAPPSVVTDATLERHKHAMAGLARKSFDLLVASKQPFNYGMIHELDREYHELLDNMPDAFQHEYASLEAQDPYIRAKRYIAIQGVHNRIVRLHRPFLVKGWEPNSRFAYSSEACIRSAKIVLISHHNSLNLELGLSRNLRMLYSHSLTAATVLAADLFHAIDTDAPDVELQLKRDNFRLALDVFPEAVQRSVGSRMLRQIIAGARHVLTGLYNEQQQRRIRRKARNAAGQTSHSEPTFADLLHVLSSEIDGIAAPPSTNEVRSSFGSEASPSVATSSTATTLVETPQPLQSDRISATTGTAMPAGGGAPPTSGAPSAAKPISSNLMQDIGLINFNGQNWDFWTQPAGVGAGDAFNEAPTTATLSDMNFANPADTLAVAANDSDFSSWFGVGSTAEQVDQATQALLSQLASGW